MRSKILPALLLAAAFLFTACSNDKRKEETSDTAPAPSTEAQAAAGSDINAAAVSLKESVLTFSQDSGMYADPFELTITSVNGETIYYTLDGSDPLTSDTRAEYTAPIKIADRSNDPNVLSSLDPSQFSMWYGSNEMIIPTEPVDKCTVVRAASEGCVTDTRTYFVGQTSETYNHIAILSLVTDSANLFDYEKGIYMLGKTLDDFMLDNPGKKIDSWSPSNYNMRGREWERPVHIDFFETDGSPAFSQDCGVRIQGNYSRGDVPKSLRFYARKDYGKSAFEYDFLGAAAGDKAELTTSKSFVLRTGANDSYYTKFKDSYLQYLVSDRDMETQAGRPCILFIDGEYWGLYTLQEDYSDDYFAEKYGVDKDQVIFYKNNELDAGKEADLILYNGLINFARKNDLSVAANYDKICAMMDVNSFIDWISTEIYIINEDWPGHNTGLWRTREAYPDKEYADGRWRWAIYDTEMGVYHYGNASTRYDVNNLENILTNEDDPGILFAALMKNADFKQKFVTVFMDLTNVNFEPSNTLAKMQPYIDSYYPEMERFFKRFQTWANLKTTDSCLNRMKNFLNSRPGYVPKMLKEDLALQGEAVGVTININDSAGGTIKINTAFPDLSKGSWTGNYFTDYPVTLTAIPAKGYTFTGWSGFTESTDMSITVSFAEAISINADFTKN